jgi:uncharacterized repeat protein (TIGR03847 family)
MSAFYEFEHVDAFTTGTTGRPGERTFYLQARVGKQRVAVKCEKQQVAAIVQYLRQVLVDLPPPEDRPVPGALELATPLDETFVLGPIGLGYDRSHDRIVVQLEEMVAADRFEEEPDEDLEAELDRGQIRVYVSRSQAAAFCDHADQIVAAGRPNCQWCSSPIDPDGHPCPRMN